MSDNLTKRLRVPSPYEKMVLHGLYASFTGKETQMLQEGQRVQMYVPTTLGMLSQHSDSNETTVEIATYEADRIYGYRYKIRGSLRPWDIESWVWVGRIN